MTTKSGPRRKQGSEHWPELKKRLSLCGAVPGSRGTGWVTLYKSLSLPEPQGPDAGWSR